MKPSDAAGHEPARILSVRRDWAAVQLTYLESLRDVMQVCAEMKSLSAAN